MKKYIERQIAELKYLYPNEKIVIRNGFLGIENGGRLKHTSFIGNCYFMIENSIYTDYNGGLKSKRLLKT